MALRRHERATQKKCDKVNQHMARPPPQTSSKTPKGKPRQRTRVLIPIRRDKSVGTELHPYTVRLPSSARHLAILAGAAERHAQDGTPIRRALMEVKQRLHAIRVVSKRSTHCTVYERDMRWIVDQFGVGGPTASVC